uniref:Uncharacterized protein n=1 Tax=Meloidogyne enterolobii TaxID=390850 RepID=A0A6V7VF99_MELEN|nr:unnamed protein product [Meloidogyne enterolobii]
MQKYKNKKYIGTCAKKNKLCCRSRCACNADSVVNPASHSTQTWDV